MNDSQFAEAKQKLLLRLASGEITQEQYDQVLAEIERQQSSLSNADTFRGQSSSSTPFASPQMQPGQVFHSMGDFATNPQAAMRIQEGFELGKFRMEKALGRGGMGEVWKARDTVGERDVVIKILPPELSGNANELARVKESFKRVHSLNHENICPTYDLGEHERVGFYLVMQYLEADTLSTYRRKLIESTGEFTLTQISNILAKVAKALDYAHSKKVIHRDIKPDNIMVANEGKDVWLIDFGLAAEIFSSMVRVSQQQMDRSGTYPYMAPEQWKAQFQDARTDQYALAVVAHEMITGRHPFEAIDTFLLQQAVLNSVFDPLKDQADCVNSALARALAKERESRFESCHGFVLALQTDLPSSTSDLAAELTLKENEKLSEASEEKQGSKPNSKGDDLYFSEDIIVATPVDSESNKEKEFQTSNPKGLAEPLLGAVAKSLMKYPAKVRSTDYPRVKKLEIDATELTSLDSIQLLTDLEELKIKNAKSRLRYEPLFELNHLETLEIKESEVPENLGTSNSRRLNSLKSLSILNTKNFTSLDFLNQFPNIEILDLWLNHSRKVDDVTPIIYLKKLKSVGIYIQDNSLDYSPLGQLKNLEEIDVPYDTRYYQLMDQLAKTCQLKRLTLICPFKMQRLDWLEKHLHLTDLTLIGLESITSVDSLLKLHQLESLELDVNEEAKLKNITPLYRLNTLARLNFQKDVHLDIRSIEKEEQVKLKQHLGIPLTDEEKLIKKGIKVAPVPPPPPPPPPPPKPKVEPGDMTIDQLLQAGRRGDKEVQFELGRRYEHGIGISKSLNDARRWYNFAAKQGHIKAKQRQEALNQTGGIKLPDAKSKPKTTGRGGLPKEDYLRKFNLPKKVTIDLEDSAFDLGSFSADDSGIALEVNPTSKSNSPKKPPAKLQDSDIDLLVDDDLSTGAAPRPDLTNSPLATVEREAKRGRSIYQTELARRYQHGIGGVKKDLSAAYNWYRKAVNQKDAEACFLLGNLLSSDQVKEKKYGDAFKLFLMGAKLSHLACQYNTGYYYDMGQGIAKDLKKAFSWYTKAANRGHIAAQLNLGALCHSGDKDQIDYEKARFWYQKVIASKVQPSKSIAEGNMGLLYRYGRGVPKNEKKAIEYFLSAANYGASFSQFQLGECYYFGIGVEKSLVESKKWYQKAAAQGHQQAKEKLSNYWSK